jgi:cytochrome c553
MLTDEEMDEIGAWYTMETPEELPITEWDYFASDRERDYAQANCKHEHTGEELTTNNPFGPMVTVCYDCHSDLGPYR